MKYMMVLLMAMWGCAMVLAADGPASVAPALEQAAADLAAGKSAAARDGFAKLAQDAAAPPFVRGLALLGLADASDAAGAEAALKQLAGDADLPPLYRDIAQRRLHERQRLAEGKPARDPQDYRVMLPELPAPGAVLHVAPGGTGDGSASRPFGSLESARDAVRKLRAAGLPKGGVRVMIHGGVYPMRQTFTLTADDSGAEGSPIIYMAADGQRPLFDGGLRIPRWVKVADDATRQRLDPAVRDRILMADLAELGLRDFGDPAAFRQRPELFCDGIPQTLSRWPNTGFVKTGESSKEGRVGFVEERPAQWTSEADVRLYGYWYWDWFEQYQRVKSIDAAGKSFLLAPPLSGYGYRKGQRYHALNLLCELDSPGEWYLDRATAKLYWLPPAQVDPAKSELTLSVFAHPFITLANVQHVRLIGLTLAGGRGDGITVSGGGDCLIAACTLRQLGGDGITIAGGTNHGIFGCTLHTLGMGAMRIAGGDRKTLSPGQHFVENCTAYDLSRYKRTYAPAVHLDGCGNRIAHNDFSRIPSSAMRIEGNDHLIELNTISRVVEESDDQGGIDMWGNPLFRGVVIRWNRWSDIRGGTHCGAAGIRLDDMISGVAIHGNLFERCGEVLFGGVQIHGGKDNLIDNNIFLDCHAGFSFSRWGQKRWLEQIEKFMAQATNEPYAGKYPELTRMKVEPDVNNISRNVFAGCKQAMIRDGKSQRTVLNGIAAGPLDPARLAEPAKVNQDASLRRLLLETIPVHEMGPYSHPWRADTSAKDR